MNKVKLNLTIDEKAVHGLDTLPRSVSMSALVRVILKAASMSEKDFEKYKASSAEAQKVKAYLKEKVSRLSNFRSLFI